LLLRLRLLRWLLALLRLRLLRWLLALLWQRRRRWLLTLLWLRRRLRHIASLLILPRLLFTAVGALPAVLAHLVVAVLQQVQTLRGWLVGVMRLLWLLRLLRLLCQVWLLQRLSQLWLLRLLRLLRLLWMLRLLWLPRRVWLFRWLQSLAAAVRKYGGEWGVLSITGPIPHGRFLPRLDGPLLVWPQPCCSVGTGDKRLSRWSVRDSGGCRQQLVWPLIWPAWRRCGAHFANARVGRRPILRHLCRHPLLLLCLHAQPSLDVRPRLLAGQGGVLP
jgi:hypothetical protein